MEVLLVDIFAVEEGRVAWIGDAHFLEHLTDDDLDVLVVDVDPLQAVDFLDLVDEIFLEFAHAANLEDLLRDDESVGELLALHDAIAALDDQVLGERDEVLLFHA